MSTATKAPTRSAAQISGELGRRQERHTALQQRRADVTAALTAARAARARALVDETPGPTDHEIAALAEEATAIASALELLGADIAKLESAGVDATIGEAAEQARAAIAAAAAAMEALDAALREVIASTIVPAADRFAEAMTAARADVRRHEHLVAAKTGVHAAPWASPAEQVLHRRGVLLHLVEELRTYTQQRPA